MNEKFDEDSITIQEGNIPYDFEFMNENGENFTLSDLIGKKNLVIYFYPKDFTPGCTIEADEFTKYYNIFKDNNIEIIGVSPDTNESHVKFRKKLNIPFMLSSDTDNFLSKKYGVYGPKKFMGKDYHGVLRTTFLVDTNGKIVKVYKKVKPNGHYKEILDFFGIKIS